MNKSFVEFESQVYKNILRPILFSFDSEKVHNALVNVGEEIGQSSILTNILKNIHYIEDERLKTTINGVNFPNPIGLSAGFDYDAKLTQVLSSIGFGFGTIGTITRYAYEGNPPPILGRLVESKSLMANKGFKNRGINGILAKMKGYSFDVPTGISIGRTNTTKYTRQSQAIEDIIDSFRALTKSKIPFSYYELNISCPNLYGSISFYPSKNLDELLTSLDKLKLSKPVFIKMPINESDRDIKEMLKVISKHSPAGVIFGNLQKDRNHPQLKKEEVEKYPKGNFSGKPTFERSNELIKLAFKGFGKKLTIIGCGGVFSGEDAFTKISLGATLVELITGLIFEGPQLPAQINDVLISKIEKEGYRHISDLRGIAV